MKVALLTFILTLGICSVRTQKKLPDYITICKRNDPKIGECWAKNSDVIIPHLATARIPEINMDVIEPFVFDGISMNIGAGAVHFTSDLRDTKFWGLKDLKCLAAKVNVDKGILEVAWSSPYVYLDSKYSAIGKVLLFQFDSTGHFNLNLTNMKLNYTYESQIIEKNGEKYMHGNVTYIDIGMDSVEIHLDNLFPNKDINAAANEAFNANIDVIYAEIKHLLLQPFAKILTNILNNVFDASTPLDVFYPLK